MTPPIIRGFKAATFHANVLKSQVQVGLPIVPCFGGTTPTAGGFFVGAGNKALGVSTFAGHFIA